MNEQTISNEWDLKARPKFSNSIPEHATELNINREIVKPSVTLHQKISTFTMRTKFIRPVHGRLWYTSHSNLLEFDQDGILQHEVSFLSLCNLVHKDFRNNIDKVILIENITDNIIWTYYGKIDRWPCDVKFHHYPQGDTVLSEYNFFDWKLKQYVNVNILRDYWQPLKEKIDLNIAWHKKMWRDKAVKQVQREMQGAVIKSKDSAGSEITEYQKIQVQNMLTNVHQQMNVNKNRK